MTEIPLLSAAECAAARETVFALSERWIARHALVPFFTLGAASYLDAGRRAPSYQERANGTTRCCANISIGCISG